MKDKTVLQQLIETLREKHQQIDTSTAINRRQKGAYVDAIMILKESILAEKQMIMDAIRESKKQIFFIDEMQDLVKGLNNKNISMSKFVEVLNEKATGISWQEMVKKRLDSRCKKHSIIMDDINGNLVCPMCD